MVIKTSILKNSFAPFPPNDTKSIIKITITAWTHIAFIGIPFFISPIFPGQISFGAPEINVFSGEYVNVKNAPVKASNIDKPTNLATQMPICKETVSLNPIAFPSWTPKLFIRI